MPLNLAVGGRDLGFKGVRVWVWGFEVVWGCQLCELASQKTLSGQGASEVSLKDMYYC